MGCCGPIPSSVYLSLSSGGARIRYPQTAHIGTYGRPRRCNTDPHHPSQPDMGVQIVTKGVAPVGCAVM